MPAATLLPRATPEAQGVPSAAVAAFLDAAEREVEHLHSLMLLRRGRVLAEGWWDPYRREAPHMLFSLSKSFTSTAIGMLVAEGRLSVDDPVLGFFPGEAPAEPGQGGHSGPPLQEMRVRHLLTMTTGHDTDPTRAVFGQADWVRAFLGLPVEHAPGTHFVYNTAATYMLSAIVQRLSGGRMLEYLRPRLFEPLGIPDPTWETSPQGIDVGGSGLSITTEAIANFGQLYLQRGVWQGRRLLPESWVADATARQVPNGPSQNPDWEQGYGYQFWRCRHGAYRGDGAFGQFCVVMPEQEAVLAITAGVGNMQRVLDLVWRHLLPAFGPAPLPADAAAQGTLAERLAGLRLPTVAGAARSPLAAGGTFQIAENPDHITSITVSFDDGGGVLALGNDAGEQRLPWGHGEWRRGEAALERGARGAPVPGPVAASGSWVDERTLVVQAWWTETPFARRLTCRFEGDRLRVDQQANVSFGPTERPTLEGRRA